MAVELSGKSRAMANPGGGWAVEAGEDEGGVKGKLGGDVEAEVEAEVEDDEGGLALGMKGAARTARCHRTYSMRFCRAPASSTGAGGRGAGKRITGPGGESDRSG
jgi:hypothetical protein